MLKESWYSTLLTILMNIQKRVAEISLEHSGRYMMFPVALWITISVTAPQT
jgi:hypothetical protein